MVEYQPNVVRGGVRAEIDAGLRAHMSKVYGLMSFAMIVTFAVAYVVGTDIGAVIDGNPATNPAFLSQGMVVAMLTSPIKYVIMFAPLAAVMGLSFGIHKLSVGAANGVFYAFAAIMGLSIAGIFAMFSIGDVFKAFLATSVAFLSLSLYGYTTTRDLTGVGRFAMMGLIGVIVLFIINWFFPFGSAFMFALNVAVLLIFSALTAYDTQRIKNEYIAFADAGAHGSPEGREWMEKAALMGALGLYLNFINMFMIMLQFMGGGDD
ncbi:MAG: Bax inhibitor-1/YccA family protein [Rhodobacteraceae bacterium]|nr:Bax inhibitor-1/YccA family protein [Paracoccaceae bacterium]